MQVFMNYDRAKEIVDKEGFKGFLEFIINKYPELELYCMTSNDWYNDRNYFCKFRGTKGDLLIFWEE